MSKAITAYEHIQSNNFKTTLLILLFPISLVALFYVVCAIVFTLGNAEGFQSALPMINHVVITGAPILIGIGLIWMFISCFFGDKMMLGFAGAKPLDGTTAENQEIYRLVENTALMAGLPMPKVYIIEDESLNAFATGYSPKSASIALTQGIIKKLTPTELQGVIAHEFAHIGNRDIRLNMLIIAGLGVFGLIANNVRMSSSNLSSKRNNRRQNSEEDNSANAVALIVLSIVITCTIFHYIVAPLIQLAVSRSREFAADATGAMITHHPQALANALKKISQDAQVEILEKKSTMATACIYSPLAPKKAFSLFSTHPDVKDRIQRLEIMAGQSII